MTPLILSVVFAGLPLVTFSCILYLMLPLTPLGKKAPGVASLPPYTMLSTWVGVRAYARELPSAVAQTWPQDNGLDNMLYGLGLPV